MNAREQRLPGRPERSFQSPHRNRVKQPSSRRHESKPTKENNDLYEKETHIQELLEELTTHQRYLKELGAFEEFGYKQGNDFLDAYKETGSYKDICDELSGARRTPDFTNRGKGAILAGTAFHFLSATKSDIIIPAEDVLEIAKILYPQNGVSKRPFDQSSLKHEYVPDGLAINSDGLITEMYEYKLSDDGEKIRGQEKRSRKFGQELRHLFASEPKLTVVTPNNGHQQRVRLPFSAKQFDAYFQEVLESLPPKTIYESNKK